VDETSMKIRTIWMYPSRTVDSQGNTIEFFPGPTHNTEAAKRFFLKALHVPACSTPPILPREECITSTNSITTSVPHVINVDKNVAYPKAIAELKAAGILPQFATQPQRKHRSANPPHQIRPPLTRGPPPSKHIDPCILDITAPALDNLARYP
jgi:transposase-like protein